MDSKTEFQTSSKQLHPDTLFHADLSSCDMTQLKYINGVEVDVGVPWLKEFVNENIKKTKRNKIDLLSEYGETHCYRVLCQNLLLPTVYRWCIDRD